MKYNGKIQHPKDLVTKEYVENLLNEKLNESSKLNVISSNNITGEVINNNLYIGGKNGRNELHF